MTELLKLVTSWQNFALALVVFGAAPGFCLRLILLAYRRSDPRRAELLAELYTVPYIQRPLWVAAQLEHAVCEGLGHRASEAIHQLTGRHQPRARTGIVLGRTALAWLALALTSLVWLVLGLAFWSWLLALLGAAVLTVLRFIAQGVRESAVAGGAMMAMALPFALPEKGKLRLPEKRTRRSAARIATTLLADPTGRHWGYTLSRQARVRSGALPDADGNAHQRLGRGQLGGPDPLRGPPATALLRADRQGPTGTPRGCPGARLAGVILGSGSARLIPDRA